MDWSAVFEDEGEEEGVWTRDDDTNVRTGMLQLLQGSYGPMTCYAFTVNYILGVGCLGVPYAFYRSGIVLGSILVVTLAFVTYVTVMWVASASQQEYQLSLYISGANPFILSPNWSSGKRKEIPSPSKEEKETEPLNLNKSSFTNLYSSLTNYVTGLGETTEYQELMAEEGKAYIEKRRERNRIQSKNRREEKAHEYVEVTDLAAEFLGPYGKLSYQTSLMMLTYVGLLAYTQVFNSSMVKQLWPEVKTYVPACIFGIVVVPLSCCDLADQITVQVVMSLLRFVSLGVLLFGTIIACFSYPPSAHNPVADMETPPLVEVAGFSVMFTTAIFSQLFQHSVPGLIRPLSEEQKKSVPQIFQYALITTSVIYIATGCVCTTYFGRNLQQSVNLNFVGFTWGMPSTNRMGSISVYIVSMLVVLFPALDTLSVFPLIANTLGNNLNSSFPGVNHWIKQQGWSSDSYSLRRITLTFWRLVAAIPPVVASVFVSDLILSLQIAGLCGIVVALVTPALLQRQNQFRVTLIPTSLRATGPIPDYFTSKTYSNAVLAVAGMAFVVAVFQMCRGS